MPVSRLGTQSYALGRKRNKSPRLSLGRSVRTNYLPATTISYAMVRNRRPKAPEPMWPNVTRQQYERARKHAGVESRAPLMLPQRHEGRTSADRSDNSRLQTRFTKRTPQIESALRYMRCT